MSEFKLCAVIPTYNHGATVAATVDCLLADGIHCIIIDDASNEITQLQLITVAEQQEVTLKRLNDNQGKGGAVMAGLKVAQTLGFSHALQIDADGQHDAADIPNFIQQAIAHPDALICGQPIYDESVPLGRKIARNITHFWVGVETLTFSPFDAMCGFRVYPVKLTIEVLDSANIGRRMDFDIEVLVRSLWHNIRLIPIKTKVIYPENGTSHFNYLKDNVLIFLMHSKLFFGMVWRLPKILRLTHRSKKQQQTHWSNISERGSLLGIKILLWLYRWLGRHVILLFLYPIIAYFYLSNKKSRAASKLYLQRLDDFDSTVFKQKPNGWLSYQHFLSFARSALDKVSSWMGILNHGQVIFEKSHVLKGLAKQGQGAMIITAHLGAIEVSRALANDIDEVTMNALMFTEHAGKFNQVLKEVNPHFDDDAIFVNELGPDTAILIKDKIEQGEMLVISGDRTPVNASANIASVDFLGHKADFPHGPFILASLMSCPVYLMFCVKEKKGYRIELELFDEGIKLSRKTRRENLDAVVQRYVHRLEYYCALYPLQWFNFFDIWGNSAPNSDNG